MSFKEEKIIYQNRLEEDNAIIQKVLSNNIISIDGNERDELSNLLDKNKKIIHKLKSDEFEIAIVGLEKAGKSTFANALIENDVLPSAAERCTFTSTMLKYGNDEAEVIFYNEKEFNEMFISMLEGIEYPNALEQSYKTLSLTDFEHYFESLSSNNINLYKAHIGKTDEEIKEIIAVRSRLMLNGGIKKFHKEELATEDFKSYIKGEKIGGRTNTAKPRSVKKIEIKSSKLQKLKTAVIYDVPGFDSPTKLHERQTLERLKEADAIILITNVGRNPNLLGTQLNIITKNSDEDGIGLSDKLFVFGNQLDTAKNLEISNQNINTLKNDILKYKIGQVERLFTGSAYKYLHDKKIVNDEFITNFDINNQIEDIHQALIKYYETDRFEILKRKISNNKNSLKKIFKIIIDSNQINDSGDINSIESSRINLKFLKDAEKKIENNLLDLKHKIKIDILNNKYFSKRFNELLSEDGYFQEVNIDFIDKVHIRRSNESSTLDIPPERINTIAREYIHKEHLDKFVDLIEKITNEKAEEIKNDILTTFINSIVPKNFTNVVTKDSEKFLNDITKNIAHNQDRFLYLVERFSRDIYDILLLNPLGSKDRSVKFDEAQKEFKYLDNFYNNGNQELISLILLGEKNNNIISVLIMEALNIFINSISGDIINKFKDILNIVKKLKTNKDDNFDTILKKVKRAETKDEVLVELNRDIHNLQDILINAVIPATNLDLAFYNSVDKQLKTIIEKLKNGDDNFINFLSKIISITQKTKFDDINNKIEQIEELKKIIKFIQEYN